MFVVGLHCMYVLYPNATLRPKWKLYYEKHIVRVIAIRLTDWSESKMSMWTEEKRILQSPLRSNIESVILHATLLVMNIFAVPSHWNLPFSKKGRSTNVHCSRYIFNS